MDYRFFEFEGTEKEVGFLEFAVQNLPREVFVGVDNESLLISCRDGSSKSIMITPKPDQILSMVRLPKGATQIEVYASNPEIVRTSFNYSGIAYAINHYPRECRS